MDGLPIEPGTLIAGKYRVEEVIGVGAMGAVVRAQHTVLDQTVAIKLMRPELMSSKDASTRFLREARASARLSSDYVVRVNDVELLEDGTPCMVMEFLEGRTFEDAIAGERLEVSWVVDQMLEALAGLAAAHALNIVHRDLKPTNIFLCNMGGGRERTKILDFGLSKILEEEVHGHHQSKSGQLTKSTSLLGSPAYMSPEQIMDPTDVDERADIWAIGCILHELLTQKLVFDKDDLNALMIAILSEEIPPVNQVRDDVPKGLAFVIWKCMSKDRRERFHTAKELMRALAPYASPRVRGALMLADDATFDDEFELAATVMTTSPRDEEERQAPAAGAQLTAPAPVAGAPGVAAHPQHLQQHPQHLQHHPQHLQHHPQHPQHLQQHPQHLQQHPQMNQQPAMPYPNAQMQQGFAPSAHNSAMNNALMAARLPAHSSGSRRWGVGIAAALALTVLTAIVIAMGSWLFLGAPVVGTAPSAQSTPMQN